MATVTGAISADAVGLAAAGGVAIQGSASLSVGCTVAASGQVLIRGRGSVDALPARTYLQADACSLQEYGADIQADAKSLQACRLDVQADARTLLWMSREVIANACSLQSCTQPIIANARSLQQCGGRAPD